MYEKTVYGRHDAQRQILSSLNNLNKGILRKYLAIYKVRKHKKWLENDATLEENIIVITVKV